MTSRPLLRYSGGLRKSRSKYLLVLFMLYMISTFYGTSAYASIKTLHQLYLDENIDSNTLPLNKNYFLATEAFSNFSLKVQELYDYKSPVELFKKGKEPVEGISSNIESIISAMNDLIQYDDEIEEILCPLNGNLISEIESEKLEDNLREYVRLSTSYFNYRKKCWGKSKFLKADPNKRDVTDLNKYVVSLKNTLIGSNCNTSLTFLYLLEYLEFGTLNMLKAKGENINSSMKAYENEYRKIKPSILSSIDNYEITKTSILDTVDVTSYFEAKVSEWDKAKGKFWYIRMGYYTIKAELNPHQSQDFIQLLLNEGIIESADLFYKVDYNQESRIPRHSIKTYGGMDKKGDLEDPRSAKDFISFVDFEKQKDIRRQNSQDALNMNALRFIFNSTLRNTVRNANRFYSEVEKKYN